MKNNKLIFAFLCVFLSNTCFGIVTPVKGCQGAYNHLFKNPYEEPIKSKNSKKKGTSKQEIVSEVKEDFEKSLNIEEFEQSLEKVALSLSKLNNFNSGYDKQILDEARELIHQVVSKFYDKGWDTITEDDISSLNKAKELTIPYLVRLNLTEYL